MARLESQVLDRDLELIERFIESLGALRPRRQDKYRYALRRISREIGPFENVSHLDLKGWVEDVNLREEFQEWTKRDYCLIAKKFFGWMRDKDFVSWIRVGDVKTRIGPEDILSEDELSRLRYKCLNIRDKAAVESLC